MKSQTFNLVKVLENKRNTYKVITKGYNMHIFYYEYNIYGYNYATCMFYSLRYDDFYKAYYILDTLNNDKLDFFYVWQFTRRKTRPNCIETIIKVERGLNV
jgi:hypothetical protein